MSNADDTEASDRPTRRSFGAVLPSAVQRVLHATVVIDYQNVHLVGHNLFPSTKHRPRHDSLVDPLLFAQTWARVRNEAQRPGMPACDVAKVLVYRGLPSPEHDADAYARNQAQKAHWERDSRVTVIHRPLKYEYQRDADGHSATDATGIRIVTGKREKGIDVLCALALVREAQRPETDLVMLASTDTDLEPALDEAIEYGTAKIETCSWYDPAQRHRSKELRPSPPRRIWNTRLHEPDYNRSWDPTNYHQHRP